MQGFALALSAVALVLALPGDHDVVNTGAGTIGDGWSLAELDRLATGNGGQLLVQGTGKTAWFAENPDGTFTSPAGPYAETTLTRNADGTFTLNDKFGNKQEFNTSGLLTARVDVNNNRRGIPHLGRRPDQIGRLRLRRE